MFGKSKAKAKQIQQTDTHCTELQDILRAIKHTMAVIEFSTEGIIIDANENFLRTYGLYFGRD